MGAMIKTIIFDIDNPQCTASKPGIRPAWRRSAYAKEQFSITEGEFLEKFKKVKNWPRTGWGPTRRPYTSVDPYAGDTGAHGETVVSPML